MQAAEAYATSFALLHAFFLVVFIIQAPPTDYTTISSSGFAVHASCHHLLFVFFPHAPTLSSTSQSQKPPLALK